MLKKAPVSRWALFIDWGNPHVQQKDEPREAVARLVFGGRMKRDNHTILYKSVTAITFLYIIM